MVPLPASGEDPSEAAENVTRILGDISIDLEPLREVGSQLDTRLARANQELSMLREKRNSRALSQGTLRISVNKSPEMDSPKPARNVDLLLPSCEDPSFRHIDADKLGSLLFGIGLLDANSENIHDPVEGAEAFFRPVAIALLEGRNLNTQNQDTRTRLAEVKAQIARLERWKPTLKEDCPGGGPLMEEDPAEAMLEAVQKPAKRERGGKIEGVDIL